MYKSIKDGKSINFRERCREFINFAFTELEADDYFSVISRIDKYNSVSPDILRGMLIVSETKEGAREVLDFLSNDLPAFCENEIIDYYCDQNPHQ